MRAERRCGKLLAEREKAKGAAGNPGGRGAKIVPPQDGATQPKTLEQMGVSKRQSERWPKLRAGANIEAITANLH